MTVISYLEFYICLCNDDRLKPIQITSAPTSWTFIHSFQIFLKRLFKSTTTQKRSQLKHWYCVGVNTLKRNKQVWVKDLPKVPMWRLKQDSNLRPS